MTKIDSLAKKPEEFGIDSYITELVESGDSVLAIIRIYSGSKGAYAYEEDLLQDSLLKLREKYSEKSKKEAIPLWHKIAMGMTINFIKREKKIYTGSVDDPINSKAKSGLQDLKRIINDNTYLEIINHFIESRPYSVVLPKQMRFILLFCLKYEMHLNYPHEEVVELIGDDYQTLFKKKLTIDNYRKTKERAFRKLRGE